jgi:hypothetical protein
MSDIVATALRIKRAQREAAGEIWQQTKDMPSPIFTDRYGTPADPRTLNRKFLARCKAVGVRPITVHDARHTCAMACPPASVHVADQAFVVGVRGFTLNPAVLTYMALRISWGEGSDVGQVVSLRMR